MSFAAVDADRLGWITEAEMIEVDRVMIEDLGISLIQMMENAGRNLARLVLDGWTPESVAVAAGTGGNGGGGLVAARHLHNAGVAVSVVTTRSPGDYDGVPSHQLAILRAMGLPLVDEPGDADVILDALIGYSLRGAPRGRSSALIEAVNDHPGVTVSLDTPSGLDVTTGETPGVVVRADATMTLCLPKAGLRYSTHVGDLYLADISVPPSVTGALGPEAPDFSATSILRVRP